MARRKKSYGATTRQHAQQAQYTAKILREKAGEVRSLIARGKCERALEQLVAFGVNEGVYQEARYEGGRVVDRLSQRRVVGNAISKVHKVRSSLIGRYIGKCVK